MRIGGVGTWTAALGIASFLACGGGQTRIGAVFSSHWQEDGGAAVRALVPRIAAMPLPRNAAVAVGVNDAGLVGTPIAGSATVWSYPHAIDARPQVVGTVVVGTGGGELFALDAMTGRPLWEKPSAGGLRGAGDDGRATVVSLGPTDGNGSIVLVIARDGTVIRQLETSVAVGVPAIAGNYAFFPWQGQFVSIYNTATGEEQGRLLFREQVSRAFSHGGKLYFGELGLFRFDDRVADAPNKGASHVSLPARDLPGDPKWFRPGAERRSAAADAYDKIALYAAPAERDPLTVDSRVFVATYYKIAVGLDASTGAVRWARKQAADFVGGSAFEGGVALCDADGKITVLGAAAGNVVVSATLGDKIKSCVVEADALPPPRPPPNAGPSLAEQLAKVVDESDNEMVAMQKVLLTELAKQADPAATQRLVALAADAKTPDALIAEVHRALAARRNGAEFMIEALKRHYDFLKDVLRPPPVVPLADALLAMKETRASAVLAAHLSDPANTTEAVRHAAAALAELATPAELADLRSFFALYRATAEDENLARAVVSVARALLRIGSAEDKALVVKAQEDPLTVTLVKTELASLALPSERAP